MFGSLSARLLSWLGRRKFERMFQARGDAFRYRALEFEQRRFELMLRLLGGRSFSRALEVGCAEGDLTERLAPLCGRLLAVDISPTAVGRTRERLADRAQVEVLEAALPDWTPSGSFDLIVVSEVLYYLGERNDLLKLLRLSRAPLEAALRALRGCLAPGGRILLAHSYGEGQRASRAGYRDALLAMGLALAAEEEVEPTGEAGTDRCMVSLLEVLRHQEKTTG